MNVLTTGLAGVGKVRPLRWVHETPQDNGWERWVMRSSTAVSGVLTFQYFLLPCSSSIVPRSFFCLYSRRYEVAATAGERWCEDIVIQM